MEIILPFHLKNIKKSLKLYITVPNVPPEIPLFPISPKRVKRTRILEEHLDQLNIIFQIFYNFLRKVREFSI